MLGFNSAFFGVISVIGVTLMQNAKAASLPSYVQTCKIDVEDMGVCMKNSIISLRPHLAKGIPEMGLPPIEPLVIPEIRLNTAGTGSTGMSIDITLLDVKLIGLSNYELPEMQAKVRETGEWYMEMYFPRIEIESKYKAKGKLLLLQFNSEDRAMGEFGGVRLKANLTGTRVLKNGKEHFKIDAGDREWIDAETMKFNLDGLFKDNKELSESFNKFIETNIDSLAEDIKPIVGKAVIKILVQFLNIVHDKFPIEVLHPSG